jgi:4-hydroxy-tetrahydrodipicolinate synthase
VGNALPQEVLCLLRLCERGAAGDAEARSLAKQLDQALVVLSTFDEGPDLVLHYKHLLTLLGENEYENHFTASDRLSASQKSFAAAQLKQFQEWWQRWPGKDHAATGAA